jgi:anti-sigma factor RsiW
MSVNQQSDDVALSRDDEQLIAYLDGQLDAIASEQLERRMTQDSALRERANRLEQAWDMLAALPKIDVDDSFTQSTIEMVAVAAEADAGRVEIRRRNWKWIAGVAGTLALAATACVGYVISNQVVPDANRQLLEDLPVIEELDLYQQIGSVDYLEQLADAEMFPEEVEHDQ